MQSRRDQAQAHAFMVGRMVSALVRAEPDAPISPLRRFLVGTVCGVLLGGIAVAGCAAFGFISPGGTAAWRKEGALVLEKETGNRYLFVDGVLRPVTNYTSVRLILGKAPTIVRVSRKSLRDTPHGRPIGIVGAPEYLPDAKQLTATRWRTCSTTSQDKLGANRPYVTLEVGTDAAVRAAAADEGLLVRTPSGQTFLLWNNQRLRLPSASARSALGYAAAPVYEVGWSWINAVPAGPDLVAPDVSDRGTAGPKIDGRATVVGQLFTVASVEPAKGPQFFVMRRDGLSPLTAVGATLALADPATRAAYPDSRVTMQDLSLSTLAQATMSRFSSKVDGLPAQPPRVLSANAGQVPCMGLTAGEAGPAVEIGLARPPARTRSGSAGTGTGLGTGADQVSVAPGTGLLLRDLPAPEVTDGALSLLADDGVRYPIPSAEVATTLGYAAASARPLPGPVLALLPTGQTLDPVAARLSMPVGAPSATGGADG